MIKIIAVHPDVMSTPEGIREYLKDFGTARGRWLPLVPNRWRSMVSDAIKRHPSLGPLKKNELRDRIKNPRFADRYLKISLADEVPNWEETVEVFSSAGLFDAAIVPSGTPAGTNHLVAHEFDPDHDPYVVKTSGFIARNPEELVKCITPGLRFAKELSVIDVYCQSRSSNSASYGRFFGGLLEWCRNHNPDLKTVTLHRKVPDNFDQGRELANYRSWIPKFLKTGEVFRIRFLRERPDGEKIHLRAIFTDALLITGHYGFGEGSAALETTDLMLREHEDLLFLRRLYLDDEKTGFDLVAEIEITG